MVVFPRNGDISDITHSMLAAALCALIMFTAADFTAICFLFHHGIDMKHIEAVHQFYPGTGILFCIASNDCKASYACFHTHTHTHRENIIKFVLGAA